MYCHTVYDHAALRNTFLKTVVFKLSERTLATLAIRSNMESVTFSETISEPPSFYHNQAYKLNVTSC